MSYNWHILSASEKNGNLGWKDSNLRMAVPKTAALPLGDTPETNSRLMVAKAVFFLQQRTNRISLQSYFKIIIFLIN
jgi:hypothetical protein